MPRESRTSERVLWVGVDTGGTFTDIVFRDGPHTGRYKLPSTPDDPARAVLDGLGRLFAERAIDRLVYGTTVATNAMLERRGAPTALITTAGFEDVLEIGRQNRPHLYDLEPQRTPPLVPSHLRIGIDERVLHDGTVALEPRRDALAKLCLQVQRSGVRSVAVCLLHAHVEPCNERAVARALVALANVSVTLSHEISPHAGEYERSATTVANAYVRPVVSAHLDAIAAGARARRFLVMQSNGGAIGADTAAREPIRTMLSGPAGGVAAAHACVGRRGFVLAITLDMGGTSTDVALVGTQVPRRPETSVGGLPVRSPCIDIHTVGAGGGSIAKIDPGGALKVGPESASADPGPACYGKGIDPTVTDANVVLGRLRAAAFLGGDMGLDIARAERAMHTLARRMGHRSATAAAEGVVRVVDATMERAIRVITVERGQDPRACVLVAFGGAAGLHACALAEALQIPEVLIPPDPGLLSAWGVLDGPVMRDISSPLRAIDPSFAGLTRAARPAVRAARLAVSADGVPAKSIDVGIWVRMRYVGQSLELELPLRPAFRSAFDRRHLDELHTSDPRRSIEVTGLRVTATGRERPFRRAASVTSRRRPRARLSPSETANVWSAGRLRATHVYDRDTLPAMASIQGPAIVTEYSATTLVAPGWTARAERDGVLSLRPTGQQRRKRG